MRNKGTSKNNHEKIKRKKIENKTITNLTYKKNILGV